MAALLVTLAEMKSHLGAKSTGAPADFPDEATFNTYLQDVMANVELLLAEVLNRTFAAAATHTDEAHDGTPLACLGQLETFLRCCDHPDDAKPGWR